MAKGMIWGIKVSDMLYSDDVANCLASMETDCIAIGRRIAQSGNIIEALEKIYAEISH